MTAPISVEWYASEADRWKSIAEANDRSYCIARDALEMTRQTLAEMTKYRDNLVDRLKWANQDIERFKKEIAGLKRKARCDLAKRDALPQTNDALLDAVREYLRVRDAVFNADTISEARARLVELVCPRPDKASAPDGIAMSWPARDVVDKLASAVSILLIDHHYDGHGWEEIDVALKVAQAWLREPQPPETVAVWVVIDADDVGDESVNGVFSSRAKADAYVARARQIIGGSWDVREWVVDAASLEIGR